jgi:hypothetical protein
MLNATTNNKPCSIRYEIDFGYSDTSAGADTGGAPLKLEKMIFWRKIVIFHTKYPKHFRASLRSAQFCSVRPLPLT